MDGEAILIKYVCVSFAKAKSVHFSFHYIAEVLTKHT